MEFCEKIVLDGKKKILEVLKCGLKLLQIWIKFCAIIQLQLRSRSALGHIAANN